MDSDQTEVEMEIDLAQDLPLGDFDDYSSDNDEKDPTKVIITKDECIKNWTISENDIHNLYTALNVEEEKCKLINMIWFKFTLIILILFSFFSKKGITCETECCTYSRSTRNELRRHLGIL